MEAALVRFARNCKGVDKRSRREPRREKTPDCRNIPPCCTPPFAYISFAPTAPISSNATQETSSDSQSRLITSTSSLIKPRMDPFTSRAAMLFLAE